MRKKTPKKSTPLTTTQVTEAVAKWPIAVPQSIHAPLAQYLSTLMQWNTVMNLVGARTWQECLHGLIIDSLYLENFLQNLPLSHSLSVKSHIWDLGSGAGLPGIPLRMLWQKGQYHFVEAREKRALFLSTILAQLQAMGHALPETFVFRGRAEAFFDQQKNQNTQASLIVSRAFMPWQTMLPFVQESLAEQGRVIFMALEAAPQAELVKLGWHVEQEFSYHVQGQERFFWCVQDKKSKI